MTNDALGYIGNQLSEAGINYEFGSWTDPALPDPYFVGEYSESPPSDESGLQITTFILTGTGKTWLGLTEAAETVRRLFSRSKHVTAILENHSGIAVCYSASFPVPTGDAELKRIQINLEIKEWSVI